MFKALSFTALSSFVIASVASAVTITSVGVSGYVAPGYVISADSVDGVPATNRHRIDTTSVINFGSPPASDSFIVKWRLLDPADTEVATGSTVLGINVSGVKTVSGTLTLSSNLAVGTLYRVKLILNQNGTDVLNLTEAVGHTFIHLPGTAEATTALNTVGVINSVSLTRSWLLQTDATRQSIPVSVGYTMYRYDHWTSAAPALLENVGVTFTAVIKRTSDGAVMPSTTSNATANVLMYEFSAGSPKTPDFWTPAAQILQVTPTSILPPDNYSVEVTMTHIDTPPATIITGNTSASASSQLLHFNGTVKFGATAINTTATSFSLAPAVYGGAPADILGSVAYRSIAISAGTLNGSSGAVTYTGTFNVRLTALGDAVVLSGSTIATGSAGADDINGVEYTRGAVTLNSTGAHANIAARLPTGVGWTASRDVPVLDSTVDYGTQDLTQSLDPAASTISISPAAGSFFICEETKPVYVEATLFQWDTITGSFKIGGAATAHSIVNPLLTALAGYVYTDPAVAVKRSNHFLYNSVTVATNTEFKKGTSGGGEMSTQLTLSPGDMVTHFPYDANVKWNAANSFVKIANDLIDTTSSALNTTTYPLNVAVNYYQHCQEVIEGTCGGSPLTGTTTISASSGGFAMTGDGGLFLPGSVSSGGLLKWGYSSASATFAHQLTTGFTTGNFLMAGTFLRGDKNPTTDEDGAAVLLLSGFSPSNLANAERPMTTPYLAGSADYPGLNFRCATGGPYSAQSRISGTVVGPYSLTTRSKYYARLSGVTGIHESPTGPGDLLISGYNFNMSSFGFSFLSNDMEDSRTAGSLALPAPTNFTLAFDEIGISCLGVLEELELSTATSATDAKEFDAWNALFTARSASFEPSDPCNVNSPIYLELGFSTHASHFDANTFVGSLGILNTGHFARPADSVPVPSRLTLPGALTLTGTTGETYQFFPNQGAYLNDDPSGDGDQFWSLFGTLDVPFFDDMKVHLQVHCGSLTPGYADPEIVSEVQIQGGWPSNGWLEGGQEPYDAVTFDTANKGYTGTLAAYRDSATEANQPRAQKKWLGVVNFDYPLLWSNSAFNFTGMSAITSDLLVINTEHQLKYLDANNAEITFGVQYDGMPQINTANMLFNALDEVTGVKEAIKDAVGDTVFSALENGVDDFNAMLSDQMEDLIGKAVKDLTDPVLQAFLNEVRTRTNNGTLAANLNTMLDTYFRNPSSTLVTELDKLGNSIGTGTSVVSQIDDRLARIQVTISAIIDRVQFDPNDPTSALTENVDGLLRDVDIGGGELEKRVFMTVAQSLINLLQAAVNSSEVQAELSRVLADLNPTLESVKSALTQVNTIITDLRSQLSGITNFAAELQSQVTAASAQIQAVSTLVANHAEELIAAMTLEDQTQINALIAEWQQSLSQQITDAIMGSQFVADIQESIKERIYDLQGAFNSAVDTAFAAINDLIRQALSPVLAELDNTINGALGSVNEYVGAGSLVGYARINADSLDEARIDGSFELKVPDEMTLKAYLQIKELDSDGPAGCSTGTGDNITEVTIGALDIPLAWVGVSGDGLHADLGVKFALNSTTAEPTGLGGAFELTQGEISFETFKITDLGASVMFGLTENYLAAKTSMNFGEYAMSGGVFFGRACDREPLEMIDPFVSSVLTMPSFTGVYCYGEATFPIYGTGTCFFNISGKAGAGVFYFEEGPTYGGRLTMGIYGEALCAVEVGGEVSLVGLKSGSTYAFAGVGRIYGRAGPCPICVEADFRPSFNYTDANGWKVEF
jgi:predicted  nucleic acid-binding Zn-ribbon protein